MPKAPTAKLLNTRGRITQHECVRLEKRHTFREDCDAAGHRPGIYPIYKCTETEAERVFGCLFLGLRPAVLRSFYPGVPMDVIKAPSAAL